MSHEIETHDGVVLHKTRAWHGLGTVVENAPTPSEALAIAGLDWDVEQWPLYATNGENTTIAVEKRMMNVRSDIKRELGIVGEGYEPVQNRDLAEFCELLAEQNDTVRVESAGSIRNGGRVWFLLKGESFSVRGADEVKPYILASNGHDGKTALRFTPTTIRVVCSNTLHMVIPQADSGKKLAAASFVANHVGDVKSKIEQAKQALQLYGRSLDTTRQMIDATAAKHLNREDVKRFFLECYTKDFGAIASNPQTKTEERARGKSQRAFHDVETRFDRELSLAGATAWNAFNAYTGWLQNDRTERKDAAKEYERKVASKLFGTDCDRSLSALGVALSL